MATAANTYAMSHATALALLTQLQQALEDMPEPDSINGDWGYASNMSHINGQLRELLVFAGVKMPDPTAAERGLAAACREWIKGCTCASTGRPQDCQECTAGFLDAVLKRAQAHGLTIGSNALGSDA
jgi:hypothetical protein